MGDDRTILDRWETVLRARGGEVALRAPDGSAARTFEEVGAEGDAWCWRLAREEGVRPGGVIGFHSANGRDWPGVLLGIWKAGCVAVPLGAGVPAGERDRLMAMAGAAGCIGGEEGARVFHPMDGPSPGAPPLDPACALLKITSGTTSVPRLIGFTQAQLAADCDSVCGSMGIRADDWSYGAIPFSHSYGFSNLISPLLCRGVGLVAASDCLPRALLEGFARSGATVFPGMPVLYQGLAGLEEKGLPGSLRLLVSAGAPLSAALAERFAERFGVRLRSFYGASECGGIAFDAAGDGFWEEGFVGGPMHGVVVEPLGDGRIAVRGPAVGLGYYPEPEPETLGGGRFVPGDVVEVTGRGLRIAGRVSEAINVAGRKVSPGEIERCLAECPGVRRAVVFGVPSPTRNEEIVACVEGEVEAPALRAHAAARLGAWQVPRDYWLVGEIPHNERGKVSRRELAEAYRQAGGCGA